MKQLCQIRYNAGATKDILDGKLYPIAELILIFQETSYQAGVDDEGKGIAVPAVVLGDVRFFSSVNGIDMLISGLLEIRAEMEKIEKELK